MTTTLEDLRGQFEFLRGCCMHEPLWTPDDVASVLFAVRREYGIDWEGGSEFGSEAEVIIGVKLDRGEYGLLAASEDYTGHGCRCNSYTGRYVDFKDLIKNGLMPEL